jgi:pSer/pThr/pTyr-binding forkhead associated (FHA) protein
MSIIINILHPNKEDLISFELGNLNVRIGRSSKAEITLEGKKCSGLHMRICYLNNKTYVEDLGSKNGTKLNLHAITVMTQIYLKDEVKIGDYILGIDRSEMTPAEVKRHTRLFKFGNEMTLPELTQTGLNLETLKDRITKVDTSNSMFKDLEGLSSKTIVKRYKVKSQKLST